MGAIISIGTANPEFRHKQDEIMEFMCAARPDEDHSGRQKINILHSKSSIHSRYSVLQDFSSNADKDFFENSQLTPGVTERMGKFKKTSLPLSLKAIENCFRQVEGFNKNSITHLITVSCTGLSAPGLDFEIIESLNLKPTIERHSVNFMGCYAALQALKLANHICNSDANAKILLVATELCTLHFQNRSEEDHLISNSLFSDGSAALLIEAKSSQTNKHLRLNGFYSTIIPEGKANMGWDISNTGFLMTLSPKIPDLIGKHISLFVSNAFNFFNTKQINHWAIHPGGKRILEVIEKELQISKTYMEPSYKVLREYGNMSSPSILFVLKELWDNSINWDKDEKGLMMAFGPGITMESAFFSNH